MRSWTADLTTLREINSQKYQMLTRQNDVLKGYIQDMVGPIDHNHLEITLKVALEKQALTPLDSFLQTCQTWRQDFEQTGEEIIKENMTILHKLKHNLDNLS